MHQTKRDIVYAELNAVTDKKSIRKILYRYHQTVDQYRAERTFKSL